MTCSCCNNEHCNDEVRPKRLIKSHKKSSYWQVRQKSGAIEAILQPSCSETPIPTQSSNISICGVMQNGVKKTTSKIKFGNETASRYHKNCFVSKQKPKRIRNTVRRNVTTESCVDCPCAKRKGGKFKNECYCIRPPNKPRIPGGPEYTVPVPDEDSLLRHCDDSSFAYRPETLQLAKDIIDYIPQSTFLSRMYRENCQKCMCNACVLNAASSNLKFTERRLNLEKAYHKLAECNRINFDKLSELNCVNVAAINISPKGSRESSPSTSGCHSKSAISDDDYCIRRSCSRNLNSYDEKINAVKSIRKDNYFETHSTDNLPSTSEGNVKEHKCIFKYTIDDRGLLEPLNPDAYGTNRCSICNKAQPEESPDYKKRNETITDKTKKLKNLKPPPNRVSTAPAPLKPAKIKSTETGKEVPSKPSKPLKPPKVTQIYCMQQDFAKDVLPKHKTRPTKEVTSNVPILRQHHEIPLKVCNPSEDKTVQLDIKNPLIFNKHVHKNVPKYMAPANTWALRYQKGCSA